MLPQSVANFVKQQGFAEEPPQTCEVENEE
jgi:hypothetical protein